MNITPGSVIRGIGAAIIGCTLLLPISAASAQRWDNEPTAYLYRTSCADANDSLGAIEISELEDDRITLRRVWNDIGTGGDRPSGMWGEIDDIDFLGGVQSLISGDFSVVVHQDDSRRSPILACVEVDSTLDSNQSILLDLAEVDGSGMEGRVMIRPEGRDNDEIEFVVGLWPVGSVEPVAEATPTN